MRGGAHLREGLAASWRVLGNAPLDTLTAARSCLQAMGDLEGAEVLLRKAAEGQRHALGDGTPLLEAASPASLRSSCDAAKAGSRGRAF